MDFNTSVYDRHIPIEDFSKQIAKEKNIPEEVLASVMGYTKASFRNKISRKNFNLHDIMVLCEIFHYNLAIIEKFNIKKNKNKNIKYIFDRTDYLDYQDALRLQNFSAEMKDQKPTLEEWYSSLPYNIIPELHFEINDESRQLTLNDYSLISDHKTTDQNITIKSANFRNNISISGEKYKDASEWLKQKLKDASPEREIILYKTCEEFFDVKIRCINLVENK